MTRSPERLTPRPARRESAIQAAVIGVLRAYGIMCFGFQRERARDRQTHVGWRGMPDVLGWLPSGRGIAVEIKRPGQKPSPYQVASLQRLAKQNVLVGVLHDVTEAQEWAQEAVRRA